MQKKSSDHEQPLAKPTAAKTGKRRQLLPVVAAWILGVGAIAAALASTLHKTTGLVKEVENFLHPQASHSSTSPPSAPLPSVGAPAKPDSCIAKIWTSQDLDRKSRSSGDHNYEIEYPNPNPYGGIGWLIEPEERPNDGDAFAMHDAHRQQGQDYTPNPAIDWVVYQFSEPTAVHEVKVRQHLNGIVRITGELGNAETSFKSSLGSATGQGKHDVGLAEGSEEVFEFKDVSQEHPPTGKFLRLTIAETVNAQAAWATYRLIPRDAGHEPFKPCGILK